MTIQPLSSASFLPTELTKVRHFDKVEEDQNVSVTHRGRQSRGNDAQEVTQATNHFHHQKHLLKFLDMFFFLHHLHLGTFLLCPHPPDVIAFTFAKLSRVCTFSVDVIAVLTSHRVYPLPLGTICVTLLFPYAKFKGC